MTRQEDHDHQYGRPGVSRVPLLLLLLLLLDGGRMGRGSRALAALGIVRRRRRAAVMLLLTGFRAAAAVEGASEDARGAEGGLLGGAVVVGDVETGHVAVDADVQEGQEDQGEDEVHEEVHPVQIHLENKTNWSQYLIFWLRNDLAKDLEKASINKVFS